MFNMNSFKVVLHQACKAQGDANKYWLSAWHQAVTMAASEHRNLAPLNMLAEKVHAMPGMVVMPLVEAVLAIGGKTKDFPGMIGVDITKNEGVTAIKFRATKFKGNDKELYKGRPLVDEKTAKDCKFTAWWNIAKPEKVTPPVKFTALISAVKKLNGDNVILTDKEKSLLASIEGLIAKELGTEVFSK